MLLYCYKHILTYDLYCSICAQTPFNQQFTVCKLNFENIVTTLSNLYQRIQYRIMSGWYND